MSFPSISRLLSGSVSFILLLTLFGSPLSAKTKKQTNYTNNPVIARVDSQPLRISDIEDKQINDLRKQLFEILDIQLKKAAVEKLAQKNKTYADMPNFRVKDKEIRTMYETNGLSAKGSYEQFYPMIKQYLLQKKEMDHIDRLYTKAVKAGLIVSYLESPNDFLVKVPVETAYLWGNKRAKIMFLEFSDYQCPFCTRVQPTIGMLRKKYGSKVVFGYRHSPLPFHKEADEAAIAAECARDQGKFSEYHALLFNNPRNQFSDDLKRFAKQLKIKDQALFEKCLDKEKYRSRLNRDLKVASEAGIRGTPGFVIGKYNAKTGIVAGEVLAGAQPQNVFIETIDKYLAKTN